MPSKRGLHFHVSIHPRGGIDQAIIDLAIGWVSPTVRAIVVSESSEDGSRHLHFAYEMVKDCSTETQKGRMNTLFKAYLDSPDGNWGKNAIVVKCHNDFYQLIGGYLAKDSTATIHHSHGLEAGKISQGKADYDESIRLSKIKRTSKAAIPALVAEYYHKNIHLHDICDQFEDGRMTFTWFDYTPRQQLELILRHMIDDGYHHLIFEFTDRNKEVILRFWANILKIKPRQIKPPTNDIIDAPQASPAPASPPSSSQEGNTP